MIANADYRISPAGWTFLLVSVGFVTTLLFWSVSRVLRTRKVDKLRSQMEIEPRDSTAD